MERDEWMRRAIALSERAVEGGLGGPFGAVIVRDGRVVAEGTNLVTSRNDPTAHAEIVAMREACRVLNTFRLADCELYASCEPCPMCLAAAFWARIPRVYYGNTRHDAAEIGFDDARAYRLLAAGPREAGDITLTRLLPDEAKAAFARWREKPDKVMY